MRKRDVGIIILCAIGVLVSLTQDGALSIRRGFLVPIYEEASRQRGMPPPVITDLDGDGANEVVLLTARESLGIVNTAHLRRTHLDFTELRPSRYAPLPANCIGFATGYLDKYDPKGPPRKQVIIAVTDDYMVYCYDHHLNQLWGERLPDQEDVMFVPAHASVLVLPHTIHKGDGGLIVIGVDTKLVPQEGVEPEFVDPSSMLHFSYYGLNGRDGVVRWKHDGGSFHTSSETVKTYPQHAYKIFPHVEHHTGEQDWRTYRRSMLAALPHSYAHPHDTKLQVHHFRKKRSHGEAKRRRTHPEHQEGKTATTADHAKDNYGTMGDQLSGWAGLVEDKFSKPHNHEEHMHPNVVVAHRHQGVEVLHLYTGRTLCQFGPLQPGHVYDDVNGDTTIDSIHTVIPDQSMSTRGITKPVRYCAGIVQSGSPGMVPQSLWNGTICIKAGFIKQMEVLKFLLRSGEHHTDVDDSADPSMLNEMAWGGADHLDDHTLAAAPLVLHHREQEAKGLRRIRSTVVFFISGGLVTCVDPSKGIVKWQVETDSTFRGVKEQRMTEEDIDDSSRLSLRGTEAHDRFNLGHHPHMVPFAVPATHVTLKKAQVKTVRSVATTKDKPYILVVGDSVLTAVKADSGKIEEAVDLQQAVVAPLVIGDFNGDGNNDIICISRSAYYGYVTFQHGSTSVLTFLMLTVIGLLALLFASQRFVQMADPNYVPLGPSKRSTD